MFVAERIDPGTDLIADSTCPLQAFLVGPCEFGRIVKWPVQPSSYAVENWTTFSLGLTANRHHELEYLSGFPNVEDALRYVLRDIDSEFLKRLNGQWIDCAGSNPALCASKNSPHISFNRAAAIWLRALL